MSVETLRPNGAGALSQHAAFGAATSWQCIDESSANDDTDYAFFVAELGEGAHVEASYYTMSDMSATLGAITGVTTTFRAKRVNAGVSNNEAHVLRIGTTAYVGSTHALTDFYDDYTYNWGATSPAGGAWSVAIINALQAGHRTTNEDDGFVETENRITQLFLSVTYTDAYRPSSTASMMMTGGQPEFVQDQAFYPSSTADMTMYSLSPAFILSAFYDHETMVFDTRARVPAQRSVRG